MLRRHRTNRSQLLALAIAGALATAANAADETGMWYVIPQAGYTILDQSRDMDDDFHAGFGLGYHASSAFSLEFNGLFGSFDGTGGRTLHQNAYSMDGLFVFNRASNISPYISLGTGYLENNYSATNHVRGLLGQVGVGVMMDAGDGNFVFQFRPEVKYRHHWPNSPEAQDEAGDVLINLGFAFNFGADRSAPAPVAQMPAPPPPPPPPPPAPPPPADTDGDGVLDTADRCPGTPRGVAVDQNGCPREKVVLQGVEFATNSATLTAASRPVLDEVAADMKRYPRLKVELQGHTDSRGADAYNLDLSQRRADSVRDYLIAQGVNGTQLLAKGYGEAQPIADNATDLGRLQNRRVVMSVLENPGNAEVEGESR